MELIDQVNQKAQQRIEDWANARLVEGEPVTSRTLYLDYSEWIYRSHNRPVSQNIWGQWMRRRYAKTIRYGLTVYLVALKPDVTENVISDAPVTGNDSNEI